MKIKVGQLRKIIKEEISKASVPPSKFFSPAILQRAIEKVTGQAQSIAVRDLVKKMVSSPEQAESLAMSWKEATDCAVNVVPLKIQEIENMKLNPESPRYMLDKKAKERGENILSSSEQRQAVDAAAAECKLSEESASMVWTAWYDYVYNKLYKLPTSDDLKNVVAAAYELQQDLAEKSKNRAEALDAAITQLGRDFAEEKSRLERSDAPGTAGKLRDLEAEKNRYLDAWDPVAKTFDKSKL